VDHTIIAIDSTLLKAKGHVWHKSSMKKGIVPRSGIDTDARWGYSHTKGWIFGYKPHLTSTTGALVVSLTADVTTANVLCCMILKILSLQHILPKLILFCCTVMLLTSSPVPYFQI
jgi:hypothetical protein